MSDPSQYEDPPAPARSAGHVDDPAEAVPAQRAGAVDPYAPDQPTARRARDAEADPSAAPEYPGGSAGSAAEFDESPPNPGWGPPQQEETRGEGTNNGEQNPAQQQAVDTHSAAGSGPRGIHASVSDHREPESKIFSNLNLNGPVPARVRPAIGEWGPQSVPTTRSKKRGRIMVNIWFVVAVLAVLALGYFFFMALTGRPLFS